MKVESENLVDKSYDLISEMIFSYKLPPSSLVSDFTLSKQLGISRTPIRQAILKLVSQGLVISTPTGFKVVNITIDSINDLYEARCCLEVAVLKTALQKGIKKDNLDNLKKYIRLEEKAIAENKLLLALEHDLEVHKRFVMLCDNERLLSAYNCLYLQMKMLNVFSLALINEKAPSDYDAIIECIENLDNHKACSLLNETIKRGCEQKINVIKKFEDIGMFGIFNFISKYNESSAK